MLGVNYQTELRDPGGRAGGRTGGAEGCNPIERTMYASQTTKYSQGLDHQTRSVQGGIHGARYIGNRGWPCLISMGGETLGPVEV